MVGRKKIRSDHNSSSVRNANNYRITKKQRAVLEEIALSDIEL